MKEEFNKENPVKEVFNSEPVAWIYERPNGSAKLVWVREPHDKSIIKEIPLYRTPQTKPLSDEEIRQCILDYFESDHYKQFPLPTVSIQFARAIEEAHGIHDTNETR